jgi:hypothetical protein
MLRHSGRDMPMMLSLLVETRGIRERADIVGVHHYLRVSLELEMLTSEAPRCCFEGQQSARFSDVVRPSGGVRACQVPAPSI